VLAFFFCWFKKIFIQKVVTLLTPRFVSSSHLRRTSPHSLEKLVPHGPPQQDQNPGGNGLGIPKGGTGGVAMHVQFSASEEPSAAQIPLLPEPFSSNETGHGKGGKGGKRRAKTRRRLIIGLASCAVFWLLIVTAALLSYFVFIPRYIQDQINRTQRDMAVVRARIILGENPQTNRSFVLHSYMQLPGAPAPVSVMPATGVVYYRGFTHRRQPTKVCGKGAVPGGGSDSDFDPSSCGATGHERKRVGTFTLPQFDVPGGSGKTFREYLNGTFTVGDLTALRDMLHGVMETRKVCWSMEVTVTVRVKGFWSFIPFHGIKLSLDQFTCGAAGFADIPPVITSFDVVGGSPGLALIRMSSVVTNPTPLEIVVPELTGYISVRDQPVANALAKPFRLTQGPNVFTNITANFVQNDANRGVSADFISNFVMGKVGHAVMFGNASSTDILVFRGMASSIRVNVSAPGSKHPRIINHATATWDIERYLEGYIPLTLSLFNPLVTVLRVKHVDFDVFLKGKCIAHASESFSRAPQPQEEPELELPPRERGTPVGPPIVVPGHRNYTTPEILASVRHITEAEIREVLGDDLLVNVNGSLTVVLGDGFEVKLGYAQNDIPAKFAAILPTNADQLPAAA
jgi:hypothetical protein